MRKVIIVGAGPAGLTAAAELLGSNYEIVILEQDPTYVGGISRTVEYNGFRFDIGGHRFFSKNPEIVQWWRQRLPNDFLRVRRQSRILYGKKFYDYPLKPANALRNLGLIISTKCVLSYLSGQLFPIKPERSFEDWVSNRFGKQLFKIFFKTYTEKVWGIPCSEISADWASQRIKGLSLKDAIINAFRGSSNGAVIKTLVDSFEYPRLGPGMMWERTRDDLVKGGVAVHMGKKVIAIQGDGTTIKSVRTRDIAGTVEDWHGDAFIISMPLRETILNQVPPFSAEIQACAHRLRYRDFITVALIVRGVNLFADNWIYIHDPAVRVGRIQNFNNWSPEMVPRTGVTCLGLEYFCNIGDGLWSLSEPELVELATKEAYQIGLIGPATVIDACVVKIEKAYPVYDADYQANVDSVRKALISLTNLQVIGRNGMHKYNNQDHSMLTGMLAARNLLTGNFDLWRVNTDAEYLEHGEEKECGRMSPRVMT